MKLLLISDLQSNHAFFSAIRKELEHEVLGIQLAEETAAFPADIPFTLQACMSAHEAVFVFSEVDREMKPLLAEKLISLEEKTKIPIIKALETRREEEHEASPEENAGTAQRYAALIIHALFRDKA